MAAMLSIFNLIKTTKPFLQKSNSLTAKLMAIKEALLFSIQMESYGGDIESDSQKAMPLIQEPGKSLDYNCYLVEDIKALLSIYVHFHIFYANIIVNNAAHVVTQYAIDLDNFEFWINGDPKWLLHVIQAEAFLIFFFFEE